MKYSDRNRHFIDKPSRRGFTLIELMITISIMGILTMVMIPAMRSFDRRNKVVAGVEGLKSAITEAKNYSMSPRFSDSDVDRYAVRIYTNRYEVGFVKNDLTTWEVIYSRTFPRGVELTSFSPEAVLPVVSKKEIGFKAANSKVLWDGDYGYDSWPDNTRVGNIQICAINNCLSENKSISVNSYTGQISTY